MYKESEALTVYQHLLDQTPEGPRIIEMGADKTCKCYVLPRESITDMVKEYSELKQHCIYILLGKDVNGVPMAYIGKSRDFSDREKVHEYKKKFWDCALVFISRANNIYQSEIDYLEHLAQKTASDAGSYILDNSRIEAEPLIQPTKKQEMNRFFKDILFLTKIYRCAIFDPSDKPISQDEKRDEQNPEVKVWLIPSNPKKFALKACFLKEDGVYWRQRVNFQVGDKGYIYSSVPDQCIRFYIEVVAVDLPYSKIMDIEKYYYKREKDFEEAKEYNRFAFFKLIKECDSSTLSLESLKKHGLIDAPYGPQIISGDNKNDLLDYIQAHFDDDNKDSDYIEFKITKPKKNIQSVLHYYRDRNRYLIKAGSLICGETKQSCNKTIGNLREQIIKDKKFCKKEGLNYRLLMDVEIPESTASPSSAASFCVGTSFDGPGGWTDTEGKRYPTEWWSRR